MKRSRRIWALVLAMGLVLAAVVLVRDWIPTGPDPSPSVGDSSPTPPGPTPPTVAGEPSLVKDLVPGAGSGFPVEFHRFQERLFFSADDGSGADQRELWVSDGTEAGTHLFKDLNASAGSSPMHFASFDGSLYFTAEGSAEEGWELWKSDGTPEGTVLLEDINPTGGAQPTEFTEVAGALFFASYGDYAYFKLWKTDGTEAGTVQVNDVGVSWLTELNGQLLFAGDASGSVPELWKSDGTDAGTVPLTNFSNKSSPSFLTAVGGNVFFTADTAAEGSELWKTDGTEAGTVLVSDLVPGPESSNPYQLVGVGDTLVFWATDAAGDTELWKSDGTAAGTVRIEDINPAGRAIPLEVEPQKPVVVGDRLFFHANGGPDSGIELWTSDATEEGTHIVEDIRPGPEGSSPATLTNVDGTLFFMADDGKTGLELWTSDATGTDAERVTNLNQAGDSLLPTPEEGLLVRLGDALYFGADDGVHGYELWSVPLEAASSDGS